MNIIRNFFGFLYDICKNRQMLWSLAKNDFRSRFASSYLGIIWAYVQPLATVLVLWYVFQVGLKNMPIDNVPFIIWYTPAFLIWIYFSDTISNTTGCIKDYSYLVKKVNFRVSIIPLVKIMSGSFVHIAFIGFIFFLNMCYKIPFSIYNLQVIYYFGCTIFLLVGFGWLLSALMPFVSDIASIVNVVIQIGFWATPIVWNPDNMSLQAQMILKLNPMFYICRGYRDSFVNHIWFWEYGFTTWYFWIFSTAIFILGAYTFKKLRPQFADVL